MQISATGPHIDVVEVNSCVVSPVSDPKKPLFWTVISDGCSSEPSLTLAKDDDEDEEVEGDDELEEEKEEMEGLGKGGNYEYHRVERREAEAARRLENRRISLGEEEEIQRLRFSFILRPLYNDAMQFLHCSLRLCVSDSTRREPVKETVKKDCRGRIHIPPLVSGTPRHQVQKQSTQWGYISYRNIRATV